MLPFFTLILSTSLIFHTNGTNTVRADEVYQWASVNNGLHGGIIHSLSIDPTNTNIIYAGTEKGVFESINGGVSWTQMGNGLPQSSNVYSLALDPANTQVIYTGTDNSGVFKYTSQFTIILHIGNKNFTVNGVANTLDSPPIIKNSRTLLPIRAIIESLGGTVS